MLKHKLVNCHLSIIASMVTHEAGLRRGSDRRDKTDSLPYLVLFVIKHKRVSALKKKAFLIKTHALFLSFVYYKIN